MAMRFFMPSNRVDEVFILRTSNRATGVKQLLSQGWMNIQRSRWL